MPPCEANDFPLMVPPLKNQGVSGEKRSIGKGFSSGFGITLEDVFQHFLSRFKPIVQILIVADAVIQLLEISGFVFRFVLFYF